MRPLTISRRTLLASAALLFTLSGRSTHAEPLPLMGVAATVVHGCLKYQLRGGDFAHKHEVLHTGLEQILYNHRVLLERISEANPLRANGPAFCVRHPGTD